MSLCARIYSRAGLLSIVFVALSSARAADVYASGRTDQMGFLPNVPVPTRQLTTTWDANSLNVWSTAGFDRFISNRNGDRSLSIPCPPIVASNLGWVDDDVSRRSLILILVYCTLIVGASLFGGWLSNAVRLTHTQMQLVVSGVAGLMLGIAIFHLLPASIEQSESVEVSLSWLMIGLLSMFFLIRTFHFHHHGPAEPGTCDHDDPAHAHHVHGSHHHGAEHRSHRLTWLGVMLGLSVHTLIDGLALGASVRAQAGETVFLSLYGVGTFLAILLHKPLDAVSITSMMAVGGWSASARNLANAGFALMCPLGAILFLVGVNRLADHQPTVIGAALGFSTGVFLCISLGDLLPEVEFHSHDRVKLSLALLLGIALAWLLQWVHAESGHDHAFQPPQIPHVESTSSENRQIVLARRDLYDGSSFQCPNRIRCARSGDGVVLL